MNQWIFACLIRCVLLCWITICGLGEILGQQAAPICSIEFAGIKKTRPAFLQRFLKSRVGESYDSLLVALDVQQLKDLQIFTQVGVEVAQKKEGIALIFRVKEVFTLFPIVDVGGVEGNRYLQLGAVDYHWLGARGLVGGSYRYDGRHSQQAFVRYPYLQHSSWGAGLNVLHLATTEPLFFQGERINYLYDNLTVEGLARKEFAFGHFVEMGGAYLRESFRQRDSSLLAVPEVATLHKMILKGTHTYRRITFDSQYRSGISNEFLLETVLTFRYQDWFWKALNQFRYYRRIGRKGNFATRLRIGLSPNIDSPFVPFVLDSYLNIRGSGNRVARGTGELVWNGEYRHTLWEDGRYAAIQAVGFVDWGTWRSPQVRGREMFLPENMVLFYGGGLRLYIPKAAHLILRADYGLRWGNPQERGLVLGVGQYF